MCESFTNKGIIKLLEVKAITNSSVYARTQGRGWHIVHIHKEFAAVTY